MKSTWHDVIHMMHLFNDEAYKHFNGTTKSIYLELYIVEFKSFRSFVTPHSCLSVIVFNLPLKMYIRLKLMLLSIIIINQGRNIYVFLWNWLISWSSCDHPRLWCMMYQENKSFKWKQLWYELSMMFLCIEWFLVGSHIENYHAHTI